MNWKLAVCLGGRLKEEICVQFESEDEHIPVTSTSILSEAMAPLSATY
jgi:hypothetical protein